MTEQSTRSRAPVKNPSALIEALSQASAFDHPVDGIRLLETHISWILLSGDFAYKIKKPVNLGFLDFSTLEKRRHYCHEELRLNRRFAPRIYLDVVEIRDDGRGPRFGGDGETVEYALKMREFPQDCLLGTLAAGGRLEGAVVDEVADKLSDIHGRSEQAGSESGHGSSARVKHWADDNFRQIETSIAAGRLPRSYLDLKRWYRRQAQMPALIEARRRDGFVRDCHGDLHLGNMAIIDGEVTFFDCIEFDPGLRWIDIASEVAFVAMDLQARGYREFCWRFLNRYFERSGDYAAIPLLTYYLVYRAMVRAKVEALRYSQFERDGDERRATLESALAYIDLAERWTDCPRAGLILMHGLSGSGKSTVAAQLAEKIGAIRLRSDVERKRLFGIEAEQASGSTLAQGIYSADAGELTYRRLLSLATMVIDAGFHVIIDATLLLRDQRRPLIELGSGSGCRPVIVTCNAPTEELRRRIATRYGDASEATLAVLEHQLSTRQPIDKEEREIADIIALGVDGLDPEALTRIKASLVA